MFFIINLQYHNSIHKLPVKYPINKKLKSLYPDIKFATRVGCKFGNCKITRFEIDGHIKLDKLIGTIVNEAAHQATGK